jgi:hypothetical protein
MRAGSRVLERIVANLQHVESSFNICVITLLASRAVEYRAPGFDPPYRVMLLIAATDGWFGAERSERETATDELARLLDETEKRGARLLASFDDDLFLSGQPAPLPYTIHILYDVDDLALVVNLVHRLRTSDLARFLRLEARIGRPLFVLDR